MDADFFFAPSSTGKNTENNLESPAKSAGEADDGKKIRQKVIFVVGKHNLAEKKLLRQAPLATKQTRLP